MNDVTILNQFGYPLADIETTRDSVSREINGEYVFTFTAPYQELKTQYIDTDNSVVVDGQTFDIVYYDESHDLDGKIEYNVEAWHVFYRLKKDDLDYFTKDGTPAEILAEILSGTDFSVGTVEFTTTMTFAVHEPKNLCDLLFTFANDLGAEVEFTGDGFEINLLNTIGQDNDFEIRTGRNLKSIKKSVDKRRGEEITAYSVDLVELKNSTEYIANGYEALEVIGIGDTVRVIDEVTGLTETQRIKKVQYSPRFRKNTALEIANKIELFTDSITRIQRETVAKNVVYNGIRIGPDDGFVATRSDNKARVIMNATEGIKIQKGDGSGNVWEDVIFLDTDGNGNFTGKLVSSSFEGGSINIGSGNFIVDSDGNVVSKSMTIIGGSITITRSDNKARVIISGADGFKLQKGNGSGTVWTDVMYIDAEGNANFTGIITGGLIRTAAEGARIEISDNQIRHYNNLDALQGFCSNTVDGRYGDIEVYDGGLLIFRVYVNTGSGVRLRQENGKPLEIGRDDYDTYCYGNWAGVIPVMTQAEAAAKTDWITNQLVIITDD